jgi:hypothetical protein
MYFQLPEYGVSLEPKLVARNKTDLNLGAVDGICFLFFVHISQRDVIDKYIVFTLV